MKKIILLICFILVSLSVFSQTYTGKEARSVLPGAAMVVKDQQFSIPTFFTFSEGSEISFSEWETWFKNHFKISPDFGLQLLRTENDKLGFTHYRYQQTYKGFPIYSNIFIIHAKNDLVVSMNGQLFDNMNVPVSITLSEQEALEKSLSYVNAASYMWQDVSEENLYKYTLNDENATYYPKGELMLIPADKNFRGSNFRLAYRFDIYAQMPLSRQWIFVDAATGQVILALQRIQTEKQETQSNATGSADTKYSGTRTITTDYTGSTYRLRETGRGLGIETYDMNVGTSYTSAVDFTDADNNWTGTNSYQDEVARDAHWGTEMTYDYFYIKHGRNSIDNAGFKLLSYVHASLEGMGYPDNINAFWDGSRMTYGDGGSGYTPLTTLDICGHEISHGLTENTANLTYQDESGALNEGFSDIFGSSIEFYAKPPLSSGNWTIGEQIGSAFRSMSNPNLYDQPDTYDGTNWYTGTSDNGGVHTNSGVLNYWYYLLCQGGSGTNDIGNAFNVTGITMAKAELIAFRTLTVYLTASSTYADARTASIQAAADLYGGCSQEAQSTTNAWYAVGVGAAYSASATEADFSACPRTQCTAAPFTAQFTNMSTNGNTYKWYFGDGSTSTVASPSHAYSSNGIYDVKLVAYGGTCGSDSITKSGYITVGPSYPCPVSMPSSGTGTTQTSCSGSLFDSGLCGDYANNTAGTITISPTSATSVTLTFNSFSFESGYDYLYIYNGPSTASPQVAGSPFSGTTLAGPITSTGSSITLRQTSDAGVVASGFSLDWTCTGIEVPPVVNFVAGTTTSCTGTINFTDQSSNSPTSWLWKFGDGQTSTLQNPVHTYNANGTYTVRLRATNAYGTDSLIRTSYITINMPAGPSVTGATVCNPSTATLTASGSGILKWYSSLTSNTVLLTGNTYTTPLLTSTTDYYVKDSVSGAITHGAKTDSVGGGSMFTSAYVHYEIFDCYIPLVLQTVKIYANAAQTGKVITLQNSSGTTITTATVNLVAGINTVTLNFDLPVATGLRLVGPASPGWYRNTSGLTYPITTAGKFSITGSSADPTVRYYYFYDWVVKEADCVSPRVVVTATVNNCTGIESINNDPGISVSPNPTDTYINIDFAGHSGEQGVIEIYGLQGQKLYSEKISSLTEMQRKTIDLSGFASGVYFVRVFAGGTATVNKIQIY
ncbi:MAG TPA: M4 family metallopeptidase [Bacteroidales bacterium]|nr:M4 family metallopeptidase [Bacteroidales bacterium]